MKQSIALLQPRTAPTKRIYLRQSPRRRNNHSFERGFYIAQCSTGDDPINFIDLWGLESKEQRTVEITYYEITITEDNKKREYGFYSPSASITASLDESKIFNPRTEIGDKNANQLARDEQSKYSNYSRLPPNAIPTGIPTDSTVLYDTSDLRHENGIREYVDYSTITVDAVGFRDIN
jgi:hypothetical protein